MPGKQAVEEWERDTDMQPHPREGVWGLMCNIGIKIAYIRIIMRLAFWNSPFSLVPVVGLLVRFWAAVSRVKTPKA